MNRVKWILLGVCLFGMLIGAAVAYSGYVKKRLDADGAETRAVLTASFSRTECVGYRPGYRGRMHRNFREKRTVYYFRYRFRAVSYTHLTLPTIPARSAKRKIS